jgi:hypothetical protein
LPATGGSVQADADAAVGANHDPPTNDNCYAAPPASDPDISREAGLYPPTKYPLPLDAANTGLSLLEMGMPGVLTPQQLKSQVQLDTMRVSLGRGGLHHMQDIMSWEQGDELDPTSIKGAVAEMAACLGPGLAASVVVNFGP